MVISKYFYKYATENFEDRISIPEINRQEYMTPQYMAMFRDELNSIKLEGKVGFIYSCGASAHQAELRTCNKPNYTNSLAGVYEGFLVAKSMTAFMMHRYLSLFVKNGNNIAEIDIVSNTCASSLYGVIRAEEMINNGFDHVIVLTEEKTSFDTIRIFHEHRIDVKASDGFACAVFSKEGNGFNITDSKKAFVYDTNPFLTSAYGYSLVDTPSVNVKVHGTGTEVNTKAENEAFSGRNLIEYKSRIGHSQGSSGLLELCMVLEDDNVSGSTLCVASGFGGFYGSCLVNKE